MEFRVLAEKLGLEEEEFIELAELFIDTGFSDAGILQSAVERRDFQKAIRSAHTIKGASGNLGFTDIYEIAKAVEKRLRENSMDGVAEAAETIKEKIRVLSEALNERNGDA